MEDGHICDNTASSYGGGVYVTATFTMYGGDIYRNTAKRGGGVYVSSSGTFNKQPNATIDGSNSYQWKNTATDGDSYGHAVYVNTSTPRKRNTAAGSGVTLNSTKSGASGGWE